MKQLITRPVVVRLVPTPVLVALVFRPPGAVKTCPLHPLSSSLHLVGVILAIHSRLGSLLTTSLRLVLPTTLPWVAPIRYVFPGTSPRRLQPITFPARGAVGTPIDMKLDLLHRLLRAGIAV